MKCIHCNTDIEIIEAEDGFLQSVYKCNCGGLIIEIPHDRFSSLERLKCPKCKNYPFREDIKPFITHNIKISIPGEEDIDSLI